MNDTPASLSEKIREQFDFGPYPRTPIDRSPKDDVNRLFPHNFTTPYYLRNQQVPKTERPIILDAGCGTGYTSLVLAEANPNAQIIGIDLSPESIKLAKTRLDHHGFDDAQFHVLSIEETPSLGMEFDYINCDEVLYFIPDPTLGLQAMGAALKPTGIIRANLHSALQRAHFYRAQEIFQMMGLCNSNPEEMEIGIVQEFMKALAPDTNLKQKAWNSKWGEENSSAHGMILANHLLQGDKGFTVADMFHCINAAGLEFISMVNWADWDLLSLFQDPDNLSAFLAFGLSNASPEEQLALYALLHPVHRVLDFWCSKPKPTEDVSTLSTWDSKDWHKARVHLHPQLTTQKTREALSNSVHTRKPIDLVSLLNSSSPLGSTLLVDSSVPALLLMLMEGSQSYPEILKYWLNVHPRDPISLESLPSEKAEEEVRKILTQLEVFLYVLLEKP